MWYVCVCVCVCVDKMEQEGGIQVYSSDLPVGCVQAIITDCMDEVPFI